MAIKEKEILKDIHDEFNCKYYRNQRATLILTQKPYLIVIDITKNQSGEKVIRLLRYKIRDTAPYTKEMYLQLNAYTRERIKTLLENLLKGE